MTLLILFKLLLAHVLSDFALQTDAVCKGKKKEGRTKYCYHLLHSLIHAAMAYLFVAQWSNWVIPVVIFSTHFVIDFH